jgi:CheY-like chemotaxis protein
MSEPSPRALYSLGAIARIVGVSARTLQDWIDIYGLVLPARTETGQALYSRRQLQDLAFVARLVSNGTSPEQAHKRLAQNLHASELGTSGRGPADRTTIFVVLAEGDPYAAEFADYFLRTEGYGVHLAFDAADAERSIREQRPNLAIIDLLLSGGRGLELCRRLKATSETPILAMSTFPQRDRALAAGADTFLLKPIQPFQLISAVKDLLGASAFLRGADGQEGT